jgi:hypothetical protein
MLPYSFLQKKKLQTKQALNISLPSPLRPPRPGQSPRCRRQTNTFPPSCSPAVRTATATCRVRAGRGAAELATPASWCPHRDRWLRGHIRTQPPRRAPTTTWPTSRPTHTLASTRRCSRFLHHILPTFLASPLGDDWADVFPDASAGLGFCFGLARAPSCGSDSWDRRRRTTGVIWDSLMLGFL